MNLNYAGIEFRKITAECFMVQSMIVRRGLPRIYVMIVSNHFVVLVLSSFARFHSSLNVTRLGI